MSEQTGIPHVVVLNFNPGSDEARKAGCTCPVVDNHGGKGWRGDPSKFVCSNNCPMHGLAHARVLPVDHGKTHYFDDCPAFRPGDVFQATASAGNQPVLCSQCAERLFGRVRY